ncbi:MAG: U32 family peptidase [Clostridia bacterium]|nr:U32 family peptidase [Clostridia bacterium]
MKILSPAGNFNSLKAAILGGADEVYLGVNEFNARNNIDGFTKENLEQAIDFAHLFGVKVFLALNVLFSNSEIEKAVELALFAYNVGIDAIIVQDVGLAHILSKNYPEIELHASTQMAIHNLEGVKFLEQFNFKRVVLARETPLNEIKRIRENSDIEIEYFAHGALCVSFSGNCYLSSYLFNASGNRGKCKQLCRLPYSLNFKNKQLKQGYLLSPKDFCLIDNLTELENVGVTSIKIEGRARRPFYVYTTTAQYKNALLGKKVDYNSLCLAFNRGFTQGYFKGNGEIISNFNNHSGIQIGIIKNFVKGKNFNEIFIESFYPISKKSVLKFYNLTNDETGSISAYDISKVSNNLYRITGKTNAFIGDKVHLISDGEKEDNLNCLVPKQKVDLTIFAFKNTPIKAQYFLNGIANEVTGEILDKAENKPLEQSEIVANFNKSEYFTANVNFKTDNQSFMVKSALNGFRRKVFEDIYFSLVSISKRNLQFKKLENIPSFTPFTDFNYTEDKAKITGKNVIYSPENYCEKEVKEFVEICKNNGITGYLDLPNYATEKDIIILKDIVEKTGVNIVANNAYALFFNCNKIIGAGLNVYNGFAKNLFNLNCITAEGENSFKFAYMTLKHCPFKNHLNASCNNCPYEKGYTYKLSDGKEFKLKRKKVCECTFYLTD